MHVYNAFAPARICASSTERDPHKVSSHRVPTLAFLHVTCARNMLAYPRGTGSGSLSSASDTMNREHGAVISSMIHLRLVDADARRLRNVADVQHHALADGSLVVHRRRK